MACERGENFGVRHVLQVVVVLGDEGVAERGWDENAGREIGGLEDRETRTIGERTGIEIGEKIGFKFLRLSPFVESGGERRGERAGVVG